MSDTINMTSSTTTEADRYIATLLTFLGRVRRAAWTAYDRAWRVAYALGPADA